MIPFYKQKKEMVKKYNLFHETFKACSFAMAISLVYPNKYLKKFKIQTAIIVLTFNSYAIISFVNYFVICISRKDIVNLARNVTLGIVIFLFFFKTAYANYKIKMMKLIIDVINKDLLKGNELEEGSQKIYDHYIALGRFGEKIWITVPVILTSMFPITAASTMIYHEFTDASKQRVMVHEMDLLYLTDRQYDSPYFEIAFAYNLVQCIAISVVYVAYDGFFCICTTHLRMKLKLVSYNLSKAFEDSIDDRTLELQTIKAIKHHQEAFDFHKKIQDAFGGWLSVTFLMTSVMISFNLYKLSLPGKTDPLNIIFTIASICHSFAPCYFAANLTHVSCATGCLLPLRTGELTVQFSRLLLPPCLAWGILFNLSLAP